MLRGSKSGFRSIRTTSDNPSLGDSLEEFPRRSFVKQLQVFSIALFFQSLLGDEIGRAHV
jgi:hypothetical protein